jgi:hypothetical protein
VHPFGLGMSCLEEVLGLGLRFLPTRRLGGDVVRRFDLSDQPPRKFLKLADLISFSKLGPKVLLDLLPRAILSAASIASALGARSIPTLGAQAKAYSVPAHDRARLVSSQL